MAKIAEGMDDPYINSSGVCQRYNFSRRTYHRHRSQLPIPDLVINGRALWRRSSLDRHDAAQRDQNVSKARAAVDRLREFITKHAALSKSENAILENLLAAATRMEPAELAASR
jgi:hypothetical protein